MLTNERLMEIAEGLNVKVIDSDSGHHYVVGEDGERKAFDVERMFESLNETYETVQVHVNTHVPRKKIFLNEKTTWNEYSYTNSIIDLTGELASVA